ncbi:hypothetical protein IMZ48_29630 [Candidatus Bathyarchaeota archaeon]|nr:hypothetical protein [Candidatus Bathyarchaeota archaeon]
MYPRRKRQVYLRLERQMYIRLERQMYPRRERQGVSPPPLLLQHLVKKKKKTTKTRTTMKMKTRTRTRTTMMTTPALRLALDSPLIPNNHLGHSLLLAATRPQTQPQTHSPPLTLRHHHHQQTRRKSPPVPAPAPLATPVPPLHFQGGSSGASLWMTPTPANLVNSTLSYRKTGPTEPERPPHLHA